MFSPLLFNGAQMLPKQPVRDGYICVVPTVIAGLVAGDQKDCRAPGVEGVQHTQWVAAGLGAQFAHLGKPGRLHLGAEGKSEIGPAFHEQIDPSVDFPLLCFSQGVPPLLELVSEFDFPSHNPNIA